MSLSEVGISLVVGLLSAMACLVWVLRFTRVPHARTPASDESLSFLFENGVLVDASPEADALLLSSGKTGDWGSILGLFAGRFEIPEEGAPPPSHDGVDFYSARSPEDEGFLEIRRTGSRVRLDLFDEKNVSGANGQKLHVLKSEVEVLRQAADVAPYPIWQTSSDGSVAWTNAAYRDLYRSVFRRQPQPDLPLFRLPEPKLEPGKTRRIPVTPPNTQQSVWYDVQRTGSQNGDFYSAVDANAIVRAEAAQRNFVQTLAKTFAHLPIGLAIFDDNRQLVLFNPAVIDLTGLGADFLSSRPNLLSFFDELRNRRLMPEPKNYNSWRQQIADLVAAAADGRYSETWSLDTGRTYRVNGRPHPDGAIAFLIEDISAEVSLTRKFRAELELGQSVLDHLDSAIAVFSTTGVLTLSNTAYRTMWSIDPENSFAEVTIVDCLRVWQSKCKPSPMFGDLRDSVLEHSERSAWSTEILSLDDKTYTVEVLPLVSGSTMIRFSVFDEDQVGKNEAISLSATRGP